MFNVGDVVRHKGFRDIIGVILFASDKGQYFISWNPTSYPFTTYLVITHTKWEKIEEIK